MCLWVTIVDWCCMCKISGDTDNLLLDCRVASAIWSFCVVLLGMKWVMPGRIADLLHCWDCNLEGEVINVFGR